MAECVRFFCDACDHAIEAWSDGNPYYLAEDGRKRYAYHPHHDELAKCIGNDVPHLCLACGTEVTVDSLDPTRRCAACGAEALADMFELEGQPCPACKIGRYASDPEYFCVS
jgi:DNA-directed RNA polymerase subunit RPC12/RpoP